MPADASPLFLACARDDEMASRGSLLLYSSWKAAKRPFEMHLCAAGDHGFDMHKQGLACDTWIERCADWLHGLGMI